MAKTFEKIAVYDRVQFIHRCRYRGIMGSLKATSNHISGFKPGELFYEPVSVDRRDTAYGCMVVYSTAYTREENMRSIVAYLAIQGDVLNPYSSFVLYHKDDLRHIFGMDPEDIATSISSVWKHKTKSQKDKIWELADILERIYNDVEYAVAEEEEGEE